LIRTYVEFYKFNFDNNTNLCKGMNATSLNLKFLNLSKVPILLILKYYALLLKATACLPTVDSYLVSFALIFVGFHEALRSGTESDSWRNANWWINMAKHSWSLKLACFIFLQCFTFRHGAWCLSMCTTNCSVPTTYERIGYRRELLCLHHGMWHLICGLLEGTETTCLIKTYTNSYY